MGFICPLLCGNVQTPDSLATGYSYFQMCRRHFVILSEVKDLGIS